MLCGVQPATRTFDFFRDTFAFRNELVWQYLIDEKTGAVTTRKNDPPPTYAHHCFVLVRAAKQFNLHARFDPTRPESSPADYAKKIDRKSTRLNSSHGYISYAVFCLKKKKTKKNNNTV